MQEAPIPAVLSAVARTNAAIARAAVANAKPQAPSPTEHVKKFLDTPKDQRTAAGLQNARFYNAMIRGKSYTGPGIEDGIRESETLDEVDEILRLIYREVQAGRKTVQRWLAAAALRRLALSLTREDVFSVTLQAKTPVKLRDGREVVLRTADRVRVTAASNRRLLELDTAQAEKRSALVDPSGKPLQAAA